MRRTIGRGLAYTMAIVIALWIIVPIYLITMAAFSPKDVIYGWPKSLFPQMISVETMSFFLNAKDVLPSLRNSVVVAMLTLVVSIAILRHSSRAPSMPSTTPGVSRLCLT